MRTIKRYSNRKLYDTKESRYCTLEQLADVVRAGEDVKVEVYATGQDVTTVVLLQALHEQEKAAPVLSAKGLMRLVREPGSL